MARYMYITHVEYPRGKAAFLLLDVFKAAPNNLAVVLTYCGTAYGMIEGLDRALAFEQLEQHELMPGPGGDGDWNAVLDRLLQRERDVPYIGTPTHFATAHFEVGTWNWLVTLIDGRLHNEINNPQLGR